MLRVIYTGYEFRHPSTISRDQFLALRSNPEKVDMLLGGTLSHHALQAIRAHRVPLLVGLAEIILCALVFMLRSPGRTWVMLLFFGLALLVISTVLMLGMTLLSFLKFAVVRGYFRRRLTGLLVTSKSYESFMSEARRTSLLPPVIVGASR